MDMQLKDKVALVTAASRGLGKASALHLAWEGAKVALAARSDGAQKTAAAIAAETGVETLGVQADVSVAADIEKLVNQTMKKFGRIDVLVINAGGPPPGMFFDMDADTWESAVQLTLMSAVRLCYAVIPHMLAQGGGSIVAIESVTIKQPIDNLLLSNSLRLAVIGLLKSLANEFGPQGIRFNSINPTWTYTERVEQLMAVRAEANGTTIEEEMTKTAAAIPLRRMGTVEEFGRTVAWLASPAASFIHGHALMFDGGASQVPM
jgi:3-oxoacyl-[acyl-carrier protein] reductase